MNDHNDAQPHSSPAAGPVSTRPSAVLNTVSERGAAALAVVLWGLLVDAAVETFLSGAPVRWWVAGIVAAFLGLAVVVMRRVSRSEVRWSSHATAAGFVLLGLLALTAWLPDGLTDGARMLRQPTSVVLSAVSAFAVAVAGLVLVRLSPLPWWGRAALGLIALYGVSAFAVGIIEAVPYPNLLQGASLWRRLPAWLQGAFVGTLIAVPLAVVVALIDVLRDMRTSARRRWGLQQSLALGLATLMAASGFTTNGAAVVGVSGPGPGRSGQSTPEIAGPVVDAYRELGRAFTAVPAGAPVSSDQAPGRVDRMFAFIEQSRRMVRRDEFDLQEVAAGVGHNPRKLFEWTRDNTSFVAYRGVLRGDKGVLLDRLGNSLDRALFLGAMLRSIGQTVRLARGTLSEPEAKDLLRKVRPFPRFEVRTGSGPSASAVEAFVQEYAGQNGLDGRGLSSGVREVRERQQRATGIVRARAAAQAATLAAAVGHPGPESNVRENAHQIEAARDHWWVQWQSEGQWIDLDPTLPDAQPGSTLTSLASTAEARQLRDLGDDLLHTVRIRVIIEVWKQGRVAEVPVLTHELFPAALVGQTIALEQIPLGWPEDLDRSQRDARERFKQAVVAQTTWQPTLTVGSQRVPGHTFNQNGELTGGRQGSNRMDEDAQALARGIGGMLSGSRAQPEPPASPGSSQVTAEWIDYEIHTPGQSPRKVRRQLFDVLSPGVRAATVVPAPDSSPATQLERALGLLNQTYILPLGWDPPRGFVHDLVVDRLLKSRGAALAVVKSPASMPPPEDMEALSTMAPSVQLYDFAVGRAAGRAADRDGYVDQLNVFSFHRYLISNEHEAVLAGEALDIVAGHVAPRPGGDGFRTRIEQGVLDSAVEGVSVSLCGASAAPCDGKDNPSDALAMHDTLLTVRRVDDPEWLEVKVPRHVRARIDGDVASGHVVLVPTNAGRSAIEPRAGWWRVDPGTGETLGVGDRGWGQTSVEQMLVFVTKTVVVSIVFATCLSVRTDPLAAPPVYGCQVGKCLLTAGFALVALWVDALLAVALGGVSSMAGLLLPPC